MTNTFKALLARTGILCLTITLAILTPVYASNADDNTARDDTKTYTIYKDVRLISTINFQYDKPRIVIKTVLPQLQSDELNDSVETFNQLVADLIAEKISEYKAQVTENAEGQKSLPKSQLKNNLYVDYSTAFIQSGKDPILSLRFNIQGYVAGMAHPYHHHFVLNYDLRANKKIELNNLFYSDTDYLEALSQYTRERLNTRLSNKDMLAQGTAAKIENFKNWNIKANGLLITFDEYQVAPYIEGSQTVFIPFSSLKDFIDTESPIGGCLLNKKRCSRSMILTGGFIDEAALNKSRINTRHRLLNPILSKR